ncbi:MAG: hypothetical protein NUV98_01325 [Candidatus Roizmanbacteria bacterium]|nr:hypothetical protein [Candidatus Roizmanbacteria bacterium]
MTRTREPRIPTVSEVGHLEGIVNTFGESGADSVIVQSALEALEEIAQTGMTSRSTDGIFYLSNNHP